MRFNIFCPPSSEENKNKHLGCKKNAEAKSFDTKARRIFFTIHTAAQQHCIQTVENYLITEA